MSDNATIEITEGEVAETPGVKAKSLEPCVVVIFGITGDLAARKLIPALYHLAKADALPENLAVVGFSRSATDVEALRVKLLESARKVSRSKSIDQAVWDKFIAKLSCVAGSGGDPEAYKRLDAHLASLDETHGTKGNRLYYLSVAPRIFPMILNQLKDAGMILPTDNDGPWTRVIVEKPFGNDRASANELNTLVAEVLEESQTYRIDHYLGKETVQNILAFRFANAIFEPLWNYRYIDHIQITAAEGLEVKGRGEFYDKNGVGRDIIQNHLLQILSLVLMEPPSSLHADHVRSQKVQAVRSLSAVSPEDVVFGQYEGYENVEGVAPGSRTPTYMAMKLTVNNWRWNGVPIYMRAGKALSGRDTEVAIVFKPVPGYLFGDQVKPNVLILQIQPDDGISLQFASKVPGEDLNIGTVRMDMTYAQAFDRQPGDAYERLLLDGMRGDATLFARRDEVDEAWAWIDPILKTWEGGDTPINRYAIGSAGPEAAHDLLARDGYQWRPIGD